MFFFKKILIFGLSFLLFFSFFLPSFEVYSFGNNFTNNIKIEVEEQDDSLILEYQITQTFFSSSRGIFLSVPKDQNGIFTNYEVLEIKRTINPSDEFLNYTIDFENLDSYLIQNDKYEEIREWDQFRFRIGDENTYLQNGTYIYYIKLKANKDSNYAYDFVLLRDWVDPVRGDISVIYDGEDICENVSCTQSLTKISLNEGKPEASGFDYYLKRYWLFGVFVLIVYSFLYLIYNKFTVDPKTDSKIDKPEFEPPKDLYPWEAEFFIKKGNLDIKNVLLSYLLWLSYKDYISIEPKEESKIKKKSGFLGLGFGSGKEEKMEIKIQKDLPDVLPSIYNKAVEKISEQGFEKGLKSSKLSPNTHTQTTNDFVYNKLKKLYTQRPMPYPLMFSLLAVFFMAFGVVMLSGFLQEALMIGDTLIIMLAILTVTTWPGIYLIMRDWGNLTRKGVEKSKYCKRYKFYLEKAEKLKLDFSNNPKEGVQEYLASVPFAAGFGILPKFQEYLEDFIPKEVSNQFQTINNTNLLLASSAFYVPPSSSSGGGGGFSSGGFSGGGGSW